MSMLSAHVDKLRAMVESVGLVMPQAATLMMDAADTIWELRDDLQRANAENAKLREQMERLVTLLRVDCDIDASWDGLRRFWSIGLTENGCLMRDRACKAEAEADRLRELAARAWRLFTENGAVHPSDLSEVDAVRDGLHELGVEVDDG